MGPHHRRLEAAGRRPTILDVHGQPRLAAALAKARTGAGTCGHCVGALAAGHGPGGSELSRAARVGEVVSEARAVGAARGQGGSLYEDAYFGVGRDPSGDRQGRSGYATYDRISSNADIAAYLLWRTSRARRSPRRGLCPGYVVEALRERGVDADGCDVSSYAVEHAAPGALGYVRLGDLSRGPALRRRRVRPGLRPRDPRAPAARQGARGPGRAAAGVRRGSLRHHPVLRAQRLGARRPLRRQGASGAARALPVARARLRRPGARPRTWQSTPRASRSRAT